MALRSVPHRKTRSGAQENERTCMSLAKAHITHQNLREGGTCEYQTFVQNARRRDPGTQGPVQRERERSEELNTAERP